MKRHLLLIITAFLSVSVVAGQNLDSLVGIYENASRKAKVEAAKPIIDSLFTEGILDAEDTLLQNPDYLSVVLYRGMAKHCFVAGRYHDGLDYAERGFPLVPKDSSSMYETYLSYMSVMAFYQGEYEKSIRACEEFLNVLPTDNVVQRASVYNTMASNYTQIVNNTLEDSLLVNRLDYYEHALELSQEAVALRRTLGNDEDGVLAGYLGKQSEILSNMGRSDEALAVLDEAMALDKEVGRMQQYAYRLGQKGHVLLSEKDYEGAREAYFSSIENLDKQRSPITYKNMLVQVAICEKYMGNMKAAIPYLEQSLQVSKEIGDKDVVQIYDELAECYRPYDAAKAYDYLSLCKQLSDSVMNVNLLTQINEFKVKYETSEKERQIEEQQNLIERRSIQIRSWVIVAIVLVLMLAVIAFFAVRFLRQRQELKRLNETKSRLFGIISHDLKAPLQAQKRIIDLMANDEVVEQLSASDVKNSRMALKQSSDAVNDMILNLLVWSSIEMGKTTCKSARLDLGREIAMVTNQLQLQAKQKGVTLTVDIPEATCVTADSNLLQTIVRNLIGNAIKFSHKDGEVRVIAEAMTKGLRLSVIDYGVGMSEEKCQNLFNLNSRSSAGTSGEKGTGLGLFVCQELAHRMGATIEVESHEGEGSRFSLLLSE